MPRPPSPARLANAFGILFRKPHQPPQRLVRQVRLVPQRNHHTINSPCPTGPRRCALNRTEHLPRRPWISNSLRLIHPQSIQLPADHAITLTAHHRHLRRPHIPPLREQMPQHRGPAPRQQHLRPPHPRRRPRRQNRHPKSVRTHTTSLPPAATRYTLRSAQWSAGFSPHQHPTTTRSKSFKAN